MRLVESNSDAYTFGGRGDVLEGSEAARVLEILKSDSARCYEHYEEMLNERGDGGAANEARPGLARELARMNLPLNIYTQWYWKIDLQNLLHFVSLRADAHAQYEIRAYADVLREIVKRWVPLTAPKTFINSFIDYSPRPPKTARSSG